MSQESTDETVSLARPLETFLGLRPDAHNGVIVLQNLRFVNVDRPGVLSDIAGAVNATRQLLKLAGFNRLQGAYADFCSL
jgi:hypothetical protein